MLAVTYVAVFVKIPYKCLPSLRGHSLLPEKWEKKEEEDEKRRREEEEKKGREKRGEEDERRGRERRGRESVRKEGEVNEWWELVKKKRKREGAVGSNVLWGAVHCSAIHLTSYLISSHYITSHHITPHRTTPHHISSHYTTSHYIAPHHTTPHYITPHDTTRHHTTPHHTTPHHTTPHHTTPQSVRSQYLKCDINTPSSCLPKGLQNVDTKSIPPAMRSVYEQWQYETTRWHLIALFYVHKEARKEKRKGMKRNGRSKELVIL